MSEDDLRLTAEWTTQADERIMEVLRDGGKHPPAAITQRLADAGIEYSRPHIGRRCAELREYGLLETRYKNHLLTERGELFLDGDLDLSTISK